MKDISSVIFFSYGDARSASTWSNVPYCFVKALEKRGITVCCVDIKPDARIDRIWNSTVKHFINFLWRNNDYYFERSWLAERISYHKIKKAVRGNTKADLCIFTSFSYWNKFDSRPSLLLCDWTYKMLITERFHRQPFFIEKRFILQEKSAIESSELVVSLFKSCAERMGSAYPSANIHWLGGNVINNLYDGKLDECIVKKKRCADTILFVGKPKYLKGARMLIEAMSLVWDIHPDMVLHLVGLTQEDLGVADTRVVCHGYLRKDIPAERNKYYDLLCHARLLCNPTPEWAGFSSTVEAMYFYTPVVISKYESFVDEFGENLEFGLYNILFSPNELARNILSVINAEDYDNLCKKAHEAVRNYTWDNYIERIPVINGRVI